jgi:hypothetical protein
MRIVALVGTRNNPEARFKFPRITTGKSKVQSVAVEGLGVSLPNAG